MANIPTTLCDSSAIPQCGPALVPTSPAIYKIASMQPLIKWQTSDLIRFYPILETGTTSEFTDILYHHVHPGRTVDRLFWPALTFTSSPVFYVAQDVKFISVTFSNIQCYACQLSPLKIHSKTVTFSNFKMTNINSVSYSSSICFTPSISLSCKQVMPFFEFSL